MADPAMKVNVGDVIPAWTLDEVDPQRMKTMAALLRDPYPIHWDPEATALLGLGERVINQGPLSLAYIANMLMDWQGEDCLRGLKASFPAPVFGNETVTAGGVVTEVLEVSGEYYAHCDVWLDSGDCRVITGTAIVRVG